MINIYLHYDYPFIMIKIIMIVSIMIINIIGSN